MGQIRQFFKQTSSKPEIYLLTVILGVALSGGAFIGLHQSRPPDVVCNHHSNSQPWQQVKEGDQIKLAAFNQKYERKYIQSQRMVGLQ